MCLVCGHVGCCDSSEGLHATRHFKQAGHPVMIALPNKPWKWCYVHKKYIINCNTRDLNQYRMKQAAGRERKKLILFTDSHKRQDKIIIASYFG